jgi:hypothetical protein
MTCSMMELAIKARLPMIAVTTEDKLHLPMVIKHLTGRDAVRLKAADGRAAIVPENKVVVGALPLATSHYETFLKSNSIYVAPNLEGRPSHFFDAGEVPVPMDLLANLLVQAMQNEDLVAGIMPYLGGLTITQAIEVVKLTMARDAGLSAKGVARTRRDVARGGRGLMLLDADATGYLPPNQLKEYVAAEKGCFLHGEDRRLMPRGLLLDGPPGVGKTAAMKYVAQEFGVPLYRLDLGTVQSKWLGESEAFLAAALARVDRTQGGCVLMIDEVEKSIVGSDNTGVSGKMLGQLLWWLQEHRSRVWVGMTTNKREALPPELYRKGRIDQVMTFCGLLTVPEKTAFVTHVMKQFPEAMRVPICEVDIGSALAGPVAQGDLELAVYRAIKKKAATSP